MNWIQRIFVGIALLFCGIFLNCQFKKATSTQLAHRQEGLTQSAIFEFLKSHDAYLGAWNGNKDKIKIDPWLCIRETFSQKDTAYSNHPMESDELYYPVSEKPFQLSIPDSLQSKYELVENDLNYGSDISLIYQFSPLLPTKTPNIYIIQMYYWFNYCGDEPLHGFKDTSCERMATRAYLKFQVLNNKVVFLGYGPSKHPENDDIWIWSFLRPSLIDRRNIHLLMKN